MTTARTIIVADDEPHLAEIVAYNIRKSGAIVHIARNGAECLELAAQHLPDLIVSDYQMPVLDGLQACITLKENPKTTAIPVLMLTARGHRITEAELARTNILAVLPKPFSGRQLVAKVEEVLSLPTAKEVAA
jgi:two-component system, OmpR family, alkaline phosphatase synthesis response regulator PhoP